MCEPLIPDKDVDMDDYTVPWIRYKDAKTCVFWDVEDYPIPDGHDPLWMKDKIEEALKNKGYSMEFSIQAYVHKKTNLDELRSKYLNAGIKLDPLAGGTEDVRVSSMVVDIVTWALKNSVPSNLIVLSKKFGIDLDPSNCVESLYMKKYGVLLSNTEPGWELPSETNAHFLTSLFDGGAPSGSRLNNNKRKRDDDTQPECYLPNEPCMFISESEV